MTTAELIEKLERAEGPSRELFGAAFNILNRAPHTSFEALNAHAAKSMRFKKLLDAEAWESAALMLVPEGWGWLVTQERPSRLAEASISPPDGEPFGPTSVYADGSTPAIALVIAALKAKEADNA